MIQWGGLANIFWNCFIALQLYKWIAKKKNEDRLMKNIKKAFFVDICGTCLVALVLLGSGVYGETNLWCWINDKNEWLRFAFFYLFLILAWIHNAYTLNSISTSIKHRSQSNSQNTGLNFADEIIQSRLRQYLLVFIVSWFFGLLNRFVELVTGDYCFATSVLHAFFVPLQGFMNAICFGGLLNDDSPLIVYLRSTWIVKNFPDLTAIEDVVRRKSLVRMQTAFGAPDYAPKQISIFTTSFNMGEAPISDLGDVKEWICDGHDIYAIGLQECLCLDEVRALIHKHLGGPEQFSIFVCEIGSNNTRLGFHGFIALTVFVRTSMIDDGSVRITESSSNDHASGANLIVTTAANKGAVGLLFQIHDTSIGFVTAHLPSDSKGKSKLPRRNENARSMLKEVALASEDVGCDLQLQHDHVIIMGDLNYRMNTPAIVGFDGKESVGEGASALQGIALASSIEMRALGDDPYWFRRKYSLFYGPKSPMYPCAEEIACLKAAAESAQEAWDAVIKYDEMRLMMDMGEVFYGFYEPPPRFPPTYKRKKGLVDGDCGDYSSYSELIQGYSHTGEESSVAPGAGTSSTTATGGIDESNSSRMSIDTDSSSHIQNSDTSTHSTISLQIGNEGQESDDRVSDLSRHSTLSTDSRMSSTSKIFGDISPDVPSRKNARRASVFGGMRNIEKEKEKEKLKLQSKLRPPSYTDRILTHSLQTGKLQSNSYGFCDSIRCSDHRPVCMSLSLEVSRNLSPAFKYLIILVD